MSGRKETSKSTRCTRCAILSSIKRNGLPQPLKLSSYCKETWQHRLSNPHSNCLWLLLSKVLTSILQEGQHTTQISEKMKLKASKLTEMERTSDKAPITIFTHSRRPTSRRNTDRAPASRTANMKARQAAPVAGETPFSITRPRPRQVRGTAVARVLERKKLQASIRMSRASGPH